MKENKPSVELSYNDLPDLVDIVGISFRTAGKIYYFASAGVTCKEGEHAIVETARGAEYGIVTIANHPVPKKDLILPLRSVIRVATPEDDRRFEQNARREEEAFAIAVKKIAEHKLDMKLVDVEYTFDNSKLLFYFTADDRVDFRELVKDLASVFRTRIELRQIGIRDEAKMMGGLGICGREFCCHSFLGDFAQVTIKMAKEQNLSLNAAKISGACGKLMCCLRYEHESYQQEIALTPKVDSKVTTPDGPGVVVSTDPLRGICNVRLDHVTDGNTAPYHRDLLNRPENPTTAASAAPASRNHEPVRRGDADHTSSRTVELSSRSMERGGKEERSPKTERAVEHSEKSARNERQERSERQARPEKSEPETHGNGRNENRGENRGNRSGRHGRTDRKKQGDNRSESKPVEEKRTEQPAPQSAKGGNERRDRSPQKQNRTEKSEKKSESKFDVKFGGGQMPAEPKSGDGRQSSGKNHENRGNHRRGGRNEKKTDKKPQKTENNN